tara:strand:+ start:3303 stop:6020 length:2718 start_codon:yes stop_codon:yes gene_type:complete
LSWTTFNRVERRLKIKTMFNFKKISAIATSGLMIGMTAGMAAAANYPAPFVVGGSADVAVVYGTGSGVSVLDAVEAGNLQSNLQSFMGSSTSGTSTSTSGETIALDTSNTRIYLNTSLNTAKASITKTDLPTVLAQSTFSGNVDAKITQQIDLFAGTPGTSQTDVNTGRVVFAKQPKSSNDPVIGLTLGTTYGASQLYNASATFKAVAFNNSDSEGETISLFGQDYVVSTSTDATDLVLFSSAKEVTLTKTGDATPSATVTISGADYTVELLNGDSTSATVSVNGASKDITEGTSKKLGDIDVAVKTVTSSTAAGITATLLVGSEKLTFTHGATVTKGSDDDPVDGTMAYITSTDVDGRPSAATALVIAVYRPSSSLDTIAVGESFTDPVFESFKIDFSGMNIPLDDTTRDTISVLNSGDDSMTVSFTDMDGNDISQDFAQNQSSQWKLGDDSNNTIYVKEMANASEDEYLVVGNEDYGHIVQVTDLFNSSNGDHTKHRAKFQDQASGTLYETTFTSDTTGTVIIDGKTYTVTFNDASGGTHRVQLKYPTSDSTATTGRVIYPTVETQRGAKVSLYEPLILNLTALDGSTFSKTGTLHLPDGDGYTNVALVYIETEDTNATIWTIGGNFVNFTYDTTKDNYTTATIGQITYNFTSTLYPNQTKVYITNLEDNTANIDNPGVLIFQEQDNKNNYEALFVDLEDDPEGTTNGVGIEDVYFSTPYGHWAATMASDSKITKDLDWYGVLTTKDATDSDQTTVTISYPDTQMYAQLYIGEVGSAVTAGATASGSTQLGDVLVKDTEISSVSSKNLIVVGGSCINAVAANVLGSAYCGSSFTDATGVGSGEFLIESIGDKYTTGKVALVVAGYDSADTVNAAKYLRTQTVDTTAGMKYKGTTSTSAELVVA